ncbi:MAG: OmpA family protein [Pirellulaceae bacterium]|nr:OmpA family protein [Pirellulaceae bacterium]
MKSAFRPLFACAAFAILLGCKAVPLTEWNSIEARSRALAEQNRAQLAEIENLNRHARSLEDRVIRGEQQLAALHDRADIDRRELEAYRLERDELYGQFQGLAVGAGRMPPELSRQLVELSQRHPSLQFDPATGVSKLDADILFDSGRSELKPGAERLLEDLVRVLRTPSGGGMKIMVAGHTDNQRIADPALREKHPNNFHLSTARALAVADYMKRAGLPEHRMAVAGFGSYQPIASNATARERQQNRRVELFVMSPDVPIVGWSESTPSVYGAGVKR